MGNIALNSIRLFFRLSSLFAEPLAIRAAEKLFTTPIQARRPGSLERELLEKANRFSIEYASTRLEAYRWGDTSAPVVMLVHGWRTTASSFISFIDQLTACGYQVVAYDGPAHGASQGKSASYTEWAAAVNAMMSKLGNVQCIIGHSLGAGAIVVASSLGLNTKSIVLLSPMIDIVQVTEDFARFFSIPNRIIKRMRDYAWKKYHRVSEQYGRDWEDVSKSSFQVPTLIIHDRDDVDVDVSNAQRLARQWPWAEMLITERLGHRRILLNPDVITKVISFINTHLPSTKYNRG